MARRLSKARVSTMAFFTGREGEKYAMMNTAEKSYILPEQDARMLEVGDRIAFLWDERDGERYISRVYLSLDDIRRRQERELEKQREASREYRERLEKLQRTMFHQLVQEELGEWLHEQPQIVQLRIDRLLEKYRRMEAEVARCCSQDYLQYLHDRKRSL